MWRVVDPNRWNNSLMFQIVCLFYKKQRDVYSSKRTKAMLQNILITIVLFHVLMLYMLQHSMLCCLMIIHSNESNVLVTRSEVRNGTMLLIAQSKVISPILTSVWLSKTSPQYSINLIQREKKGNICYRHWLPPVIQVKYRPNAEG